METSLTNCHLRTFEGAIASVTVNMEFQVPGYKYSCSIVKNLNCIIVYSDILNYKHVTKYIFFAWDDIL